MCACENGGTCLEAGESPSLNENGHYKTLCDCPEFYGGVSCETEMRGCNFSMCPDYAQCVENDVLPEGYECIGCDVGYQSISLPGLQSSTCIGE